MSVERWKNLALLVFLALDLCGWKNQNVLNVRWRSGVAYNVLWLCVVADFEDETFYFALKFN